MSCLLVSVRDAAEADDALAGGADLIDVKEPSHGSLGAAPTAAVREIIKTVDERRPVSVALGELVDIGERDFKHCAGARFAKVGLGGCLNRPNWPERWRDIVSRLPQGVAPVAVTYADYATCGAPSPREVLWHAARIGCVAALVDTCDKARGRLLQQWTSEELATFARAVRSYGMMLVLAGSLSIADITALVSYEADYLAVRTAVCENDRSGQLNPSLVEQFARQLNRQSVARKSKEKLPVKFA